MVQIVVSLGIEWSRLNEAYFKLIHNGLGRNGVIQAGMLVLAESPDHRVPTLSPLPLSP